MKVLMVCSLGMSSSIAVNALTKAAKDANIDIEVKSVSTQEFESEVKKGWDIALVAPQIRHRYSILNEMAEKSNIPCVLIEPRSYSPLGGEMLLGQIKKTLNI